MTQGQNMAGRLDVLQERARSLSDTLLPDGGKPADELPDNAVAEIFTTLSNGDFLRLPLDTQFTVLDSVHSAYGKTFHPSAPRLVRLIQGIFQFYLHTGGVSLSRLFKTYDLAYFLYWCASVSIEEQRGFDANVVRPFSRYLSNYFSSMDLRPRLDASAGRAALGHTNRRIRLCYLAEFLTEGGGNALTIVTAGVLSGLCSHFSSRYEVFLYAWRYQDPGFVAKMEALGVVVRSFNLREYSEPELWRLRRSFFEDQIDVAITDMNSAVPHFLFESRVAPAQVFYQLGMPFWGLWNLDAVFQGWEIAPEILGFRDQQCVSLSGPKAVSCLDSPIDQSVVQKERARFPRSRRMIGYYGRLVKITPPYLDIVARILDRHPDTIAVLGGSGNGDLIREFVTAKGLEGRLLVVDEFVDGHVWGHFLDVFLDTFPLMGGYSCLEMMAKGKPVVHMPSDEMSNLSMLRDPRLQAARPDEYVEVVGRLLTDKAFYQQACGRALEIYQEQADTKQFGEKVHAAIQRVIGLRTED